mmetsp:Transcript_6587/g.9428  ORF Transcript_6587/g.9428 Transcript_6587/m.9428 type:complete len:356 (+) Transcript_6587:83-1150(+)
MDIFSHSEDGMMMPMQTIFSREDAKMKNEDTFIEDAINDSGLSPLSLSPSPPLVSATNSQDSTDSESQSVPLNAPKPLKEKVKNGTVSLALSPFFAMYGILYVLSLVMTTILCIPILHSNIMRKQAPFLYALWFIMIGSAIMTILIVDRNTVKAARDLDPGHDFIAIVGGKCNITDVIFKESKHTCHGKICGCYDGFTYMFEAPQLASIDAYAGRESYVFQSIMDMRYREGSNSQSCHDDDGVDVDVDVDFDSKASPRWKPGVMTKCWRPDARNFNSIYNDDDANVTQIIPMLDEIQKMYRCGNEDCIKVFAPYYDTDYAVENAIRFEGVTAIPIFILISLAVAQVVSMYRRKWR